MVGLLDSHDTGKATIIKGGPLPVINGVTTVSRVIAPVTRLFSVFYRGPITPLITIGSGMKIHPLGVTDWMDWNWSKMISFSLRFICCFFVAGI